MTNAVKNIIIVKIRLSPTKAGNGFKPKNSPSLKKEVKFSTAIAHKYNKKIQNTIKIAKSFGATLNFIHHYPFAF